jgi:hypothetical protein
MLLTYLRHPTCVVAAGAAWEMLQLTGEPTRAFADVPSQRPGGGPSDDVTEGLARMVLAREFSVRFAGLETRS